MKRLPLAFVLLASATLCFAGADGSWLRKVPAAERQRANPFAGKPEAIAAGRSLFLENCARCHGADAQGKGSRPALRSQRIAAATDGDLAWMLKNGEVYKGMPRWAGLPEPERWQIVSYLRSLNTAVPEVQP